MADTSLSGDGLFRFEIYQIRYQLLSDISLYVCLDVDTNYIEQMLLKQLFKF